MNAERYTPKPTAEDILASMPKTYQINNGNYEDFTKQKEIKPVIPVKNPLQLNWNEVNREYREQLNKPVQTAKSRGKLVMTGRRRKGEPEFTKKYDGVKK